MMLLYGFAAFGAMWWLSKVFVRSDTKAVAKAVKIVGGVLALGLAVLLGVKGRIDMALLLGGVGAWALGWSGFNCRSVAQAGQWRGDRACPLGDDRDGDRPTFRAGREMC